MRLALIFEKSQPYTTGIYFARACDALKIAYDHWGLDALDDIPATYDLYLRIDHGDDYAARLPARLRPRAFYVFDTHLLHTWRKVRRVAAEYDLVFCCHRAGAERLSQGVWLPVACDPALHAADAEPALWDVGFVGTDGGVPRKFYLQALRERYPNSRIGPAPYTELAGIYGRARIGFNYAIADDVNMRVFEVLAAGALLVTNRLSHNDLHRLGLEDRRHLVVYEQPTRLCDIIDYYLAHPEERAAIARAGQAAVLQRHTYTHRLQQLLKEAGARLGLAIPQDASTGS